MLTRIENLMIAFYNQGGDSYSENESMAVEAFGWLTVNYGSESDALSEALSSDTFFKGALGFMDSVWEFEGDGGIEGEFLPPSDYLTANPEIAPYAETLRRLAKWAMM